MLYDREGLGNVEWKVTEEERSGGLEEKTVGCCHREGKIRDAKVGQVWSTICRR